MLNVICTTFKLTSTAVRNYQFTRITCANWLYPFINNNTNFQSNSARYFCSNMSPKAIVLLASGAEELEFVTVVNVLRRGGIEVTVAGVCGAEAVTCRSDTVITPDISLKDAVCQGPYEAIVLPGGLGGSKILAESEEVGKLLKEQEKRGGLITAICAAPTALKAHNIGAGKRITSYPTMAEELKKGGIYKYEDNCPVVVDGNLITSRGPATALMFSFTILEHLQNKEKAKEVAKAMLFEY